MTMTPTNAEGIALARAKLGGRTHKRVVIGDSSIVQLPTSLAARRLASAIRVADRMARQVPEDVYSVGLDRRRAYADQLCLDADLYTHLEAAALLDGDDAA